MRSMMGWVVWRSGTGSQGTGIPMVRGRERTCLGVSVGTPSVRVTHEPTQPCQCQSTRGAEVIYLDVQPEKGLDVGGNGSRQEVSEDSFELANCFREIEEDVVGQGKS